MQFSVFTTKIEKRAFLHPCRAMELCFPSDVKARLNAFMRVCWQHRPVSDSTAVSELFVVVLNAGDELVF